MGIMNPGAVAQTGLDRHFVAAGYANFGAAVNSAHRGDQKARGILAQVLKAGGMDATQQAAAIKAIGREAGAI